MSAKRVTRKQLLKEPDEFITFSGKLIQFLNRYRRQISGGLIAVIILLAGIAGYRYHVHRSELRASAQLAEIQTEYATLRAEGDTASAYQGIKSKIDTLIEKYSNRSSGKLARIIAGDFSYRAGQYDAAQSYYEQARGSFPADTVYASRLLSGLAYTYLAQNNTAQAHAYFEKAAEGANSLLADEALLNLAILAAADNREAESQKFWERIASDYEDSPFGEIAREKSGQPDA